MEQNINLSKRSLNDLIQAIINDEFTECASQSYVTTDRMILEMILEEDYENPYQSMNIDSYKRYEQLYEKLIANRHLIVPNRYLMVSIDGKIHSTPIRFIDLKSVCDTLDFYINTGHSVKITTAKLKTNIK